MIRLRDGRDVTVRTPRREDAAEVLTAAQEIFATSEFLGTELDEFRVTPEQEAEVFEAAVLCPRSVWVVAFDQKGKALGLINFRPGGRRRLAHQGTLGMSIRAEWRGVGLGSVLLRSLINWAEDNYRIATLRLSVAEMNLPAIQLYRKLGFIEEGREVDLLQMPNGQTIDCLSMARKVSERYVPTLSTKRLVLTPVDESMAADYERNFVDYEVVRHLSSGVPWPYPIGGILEYLKKSVVSQQGRGRWVWGLFLKSAPAEMIGVVDLWREGRPENRGFWLARPKWGQGLMTEACEVVNRYAFEQLGFTTLVFSNAVGNLASRRVKEKTGARLIGTRKAGFVDSSYTEAETWELTKQDWLARHADGRAPNESQHGEASLA